MEGCSAKNHGVVDPERNGGEPLAWISGQWADNFRRWPELVQTCNVSSHRTELHRTPLYAQPDARVEVTDEMVERGAKALADVWDTLASDEERWIAREILTAALSPAKNHTADGSETR